MSYRYITNAEFCYLFLLNLYCVKTICIFSVISSCTQVYLFISIVSWQKETTQLEFFSSRRDLRLFRLLHCRHEIYWRRLLHCLRILLFHCHILHLMAFVTSFWQYLCNFAYWLFLITRFLIWFYNDLIEKIFVSCIHFIGWRKIQEERVKTNVNEQN